MPTEDVTYNTHRGAELELSMVSVSNLQIALEDTDAPLHDWFAARNQLQMKLHDYYRNEQALEDLLKTYRQQPLFGIKVGIDKVWRELEFSYKNISNEITRWEISTHSCLNIEHVIGRLQVMRYKRNVQPEWWDPKIEYTKRWLLSVAGKIHMEVAE